MDSDLPPTSNSNVSQEIRKVNTTTTSPESSMAEFGTSVSVLVQESAQAVTETVANGVPKAVHTVQEQLSTVVGGAKKTKDSISDSLSEESQVDGEHIEKMPDERVCDFLRQKNMSNARTNFRHGSRK